MNIKYLKQSLFVFFFREKEIEDQKIKSKKKGGCVNSKRGPCETQNTKQK